MCCGLKICILVWNYAPLRIGGAENQVRKLARALTARKHKVWILTRRHYSTSRIETVDGIEVRRIDCASQICDKLMEILPPELPGNTYRPLWLRLFPIRGAGGYLQHWLFMKRASAFLRIHRNDFDVLDVHMLDWLAGWAGQLKRRYGYPVVGTQATFPALLAIEKPSIPNRRGLEKDLHALSIYVGKTRAAVEDLAWKGIEKSRIRLIPNSVEIPGTTADVVANSDVVYIGNLTQGSSKAFDILFEAWVMVAKQTPSAHLTVVGSGDSGEYVKQLRQAGCEASVTFAGYMEDVAPAYLKAGLFILASRREGMSNALLEAMSYGLPAVVTDIPGNTAVVQDGKNGLVVPVNNASAFAEAIVRLLDNPPLRRELGRRARQIAEQQFNISKVVEQMTGAYRDAIALAQHRD